MDHAITLNPDALLPEQRSTCTGQTLGKRFRGRMKRTGACAVIGSLMTIAAQAQAQEPDSIPGTAQVRAAAADSMKEAAMEQAALLFPRLRQFSITHQMNGRGSMDSKLNGNEFFDGDLISSRTVINMNMPVWKRKHQGVVASLGVIHQFYRLRSVESLDTRKRMEDNATYMPMFSPKLTYIRTDSIFGKAISTTAMAGGLFNPGFTKSQFTLTGMITTPVIRNKHIRLMGGMAVLLDPASPVPAFLVVSYYHKFGKAKMDLMLNLPYQMTLRKELDKHTSLSFVNELGGSNSFFEFAPDVPAIPTEKLVLSSMEVRSGLLAEYRVGKKSVFSLSGGMDWMVNSRVRESHSAPDDYFLKNKHKPTPFVQAGFSLLPFWEGLNF